MKTENRKKKGHYITMGLVTGLPVGIPIGMALGNIALGPLVGVSIGLLVGWLLERKYNKDGIPLEPGEQKSRKWASLVLLGVGVFAFFASLYLFVVFN